MNQGVSVLGGDAGFSSENEGYKVQHTGRQMLMTAGYGTGQPEELTRFGHQDGWCKSSVGRETVGTRQYP